MTVYPDFELAQRHIAEVAVRARVVFGSLTGIEWSVALQPDAPAGGWEVVFQVRRATSARGPVRWAVHSVWMLSFGGEENARLRHLTIERVLRALRDDVRESHDWVPAGCLDRAVRAPALTSHSAGVRAAQTLPRRRAGLRRPRAPRAHRAMTDVVALPPHVRAVGLDGRTVRRVATTRPVAGGSAHQIVVDIGALGRHPDVAEQALIDVAIYGDAWLDEDGARVDPLDVVISVVDG